MKQFSTNIGLIVILLIFSPGLHSEQNHGATSMAEAKIEPDRDNPFIGFYCGQLDDHLEWCQSMHLGYSKNKMQNMVIPYLKTQTQLQEKQILKLVHEIENSYARYNVIPWLSLSLHWVTGSFGAPADVARFFDDHGTVIDEWFQMLNTHLENLDTDVDLKPRRYRFESEANLYRYGGKPEIYYETTRHIYRIFKQRLPDSTLVISLAVAETLHAENYLRPMLEYHRDTYPGEPLPFHGIQCSCHSRDYMHSVDVYYLIQALFKDVFGEVAGSNYFNESVFWSNENSGYALGTVSTPGLIYGTDRERARQDIKCVTQFLSLPNTLMVNVDRRLEGDRKPKLKDNFHNLNGLEQNGCGVFDRGDGFVSPALKSLKLFTGYVYEYRPQFNNLTTAVRVFDFVHRRKPGDHRLIIWREYGDETEVARIEVPEAWKTVRDVRVVNLIDGTEKLIPLNSSKQEIHLKVDDNPVIVFPEVSERM